MKQVESLSGGLPEHFWTVTPHSDPGTEIGPFATYEEARKFGTARFLMHASISEYSDVRLRESGEITAEEYTRFTLNPKMRGLVDPASL